MSLHWSSLKDQCSAGSYVSAPPLLSYVERGRSEPLFSPSILGSVGFNSPRGIAIDSTSTFMYVADGSNMHVWRLHLGNGGITQMDLTGTVLSNVWGLTLDEVAGVLYVSDLNLHNIYRLTLSNGILGPPIAGFNTIYEPRQMVLDSTRTILYVADSSPSSGRHVWRVGLVDGSVTTVELGFAFSFPLGITINAANTLLYVTDYNNARIYSVSTSTGVVNRVDTGGSLISQPRDIYLDLNETNLLLLDSVR
jgi:DNA-binding beta-propeller fold protein YncE